jgi:hypothetical protein
MPEPDKFDRVEYLFEVGKRVNEILEEQHPDFYRKLLGIKSITGTAK